MTIDDAKNLSREHVEACAERVLNGTATPAEAEAVALWTKHTVRWIRALAARGKCKEQPSLFDVPTEAA